MRAVLARIDRNLNASWALLALHEAVGTNAVPPIAMAVAHNLTEAGYPKPLAVRVALTAPIASLWPGPVR